MHRALAIMAIAFYVLGSMTTTVATLGHELYHRLHGDEGPHTHTGVAVHDHHHAPVSHSHHAHGHDHAPHPAHHTEHAHHHAAHHSPATDEHRDQNDREHAHAPLVDLLIRSSDSRDGDAPARESTVLRGYLEPHRVSQASNRLRPIDPAGALLRPFCTRRPVAHSVRPPIPPPRASIV